MTTKVKAVLLGGLVAAASLFACFCLFFPAVYLVSILDLDNPRWSRESIVTLYVVILLSLWVSARIGWRVGQDWTRNGRDALSNAR